MQSYQISCSKRLIVAAISSCSFLLIKTGAAELRTSDGLQDGLGVEAIVDAGNCLATSGGATVGQVANSGACYFFRNFAPGPVFDTEEVKLVPSDPTSYENFGRYLGLSGNIALVSKYAYPAYLYQHLDTAQGTVTENAKFDYYQGRGARLSGTNGLLGTYFYRRLDQVSGLNPTPDAILSASDQGIFDYYCDSNSLSGNSALAGYANDGGVQRGGVYYYRDLSTATGTIREDAKLISPEPNPNGLYGVGVSLSSTRALVAAPYLTVDSYRNRGEAYFYRNLNTATGLITAQTQLQANPAYLQKKDNLYFADVISLSGDDALISGGNGAYLFRHLDQTSGTIYEDVKIKSSVIPMPGFNGFAGAVSLDGDSFAIGDSGRDNSTGVVYTGNISALTTADFGNGRKQAAGVSFTSHLDWVAGETTDGNQIILNVGDTATVRDAGKAVYIGKNAGSDNNLLEIAGSLQCTYTYIGSITGNVGNTLQVESTGKVAATALRLAKGNLLLIAGNATTAKTFLQTAPLQVFANGAWKTVTAANFRTLVSITQSGGYTVVIPAGE